MTKLTDVPEALLCSATDYVTAMPDLAEASHDTVFRAAVTGRTEPVYLRRFDDLLLNEAGEVFDADGILPDWFASAEAWRERDAARYARKFDRAAIGSTLHGGPYLWITDRFSHVYYHWLTGALARLEAASGAGCARSLLLPARILEQPFVRATLNAYRDFAIAAPVAGNVQAGPIDLVTRAAVPPDLHPALLKRVRERLRDHCLAGMPRRPPQRRIYASRRLARHRRMVNEAALMPVLERHGFEVLALEELPFEAQVGLMSETSVLVGPHGAGLTNAMFMEQGATLVELRQLEGPPLSFFKLAGLFGLAYCYGVCDSAEPDQHHHGADVRIDPVELDRVLGGLDAG